MPPELGGIGGRAPHLGGMLTASTAWGEFLALLLLLRGNGESPLHWWRVGCVRRLLEKAITITWGLSRHVTMETTYQNNKALYCLSKNSCDSSLAFFSHVCSIFHLLLTSVHCTPILSSVGRTLVIRRLVRWVVRGATMRARLRVAVWWDPG